MVFIKKKKKAVAKYWKKPKNFEWKIIILSIHVLQ